MEFQYILIGAFLILIIGYFFLRQENPYPGFDNISDYMSPFNHGFALRGGLFATTQEQAFRNALIIGATGSGKTSAVLLSSLFSLARGNASMVVLDVSSENKKRSSGYFASRKNYKVYSLDFSETSDAINPITLCQTTEELERVAHTLIKNAGVEAKSDPYWSSSAEMVLSLFMQYLFYYGKEEEKNMANVVLLLQTYMAEPAKVDVLFIRCKDSRLLRLYKVLNSVPEKNRQSVLSVAITATKLFTSPGIARCTAINTIDFKSFRETPSILYLCIPLNQVSFLAPLTAVLFDLFFQEVMSQIPPEDKLPIFFMIDEMATVKLDFGFLFSQCRKYRVGVMGLLQDEYMLRLKNTDPESFAIKSNACNKVYLSPNLSLPTCRELQEVIGKGVIEQEDGSQRQGYFMEVAELRKLCNEAIIQINAALLREPVKYAHSHFRYSRWTAIPPYEGERKIPFDEVSFMQIS